MTMRLTIFPNCRDAAQALAESVCQDLQRALSARPHGRALLLLSGGRSPLPFFAALSAQPLDWARVDVSLVDERGVLFEHADSNAALLARHFLQGPAHAARLLPLMLPAAQESALEWVRRSADAACANSALARPDVIVLGLGTDGHTASLFRDSPQWEEAISTARPYIALTPGQAPHARISLSLSALIRQGQCYVWSSGAEKLAVIRQAETAADPRDAGPFALLAARPDVTLKVFHCRN